MTNVAAVTALDLNGHTTTYSLTGTVPVTTVPEQKGDPKVTATSIAGSVKPTAPPPTT